MSKLSIKGIRMKDNECLSCVEENNCYLILDPEKTFTVFNVEKIPGLSNHCDSIVVEAIHDSNRPKLHIYYVELRAISKYDSKIISDMVLKINKSHTILSPTLESIGSNFNQYETKKHFVIVLHGNIIKGMKQSIIRVQNILMNYKYDYIYIIESGSKLGMVGVHYIFNRYRT